VSDGRRPVAADVGRHYSYEHYADRGVAERFDALRFGGPVGRRLAETQEALLLEALAPVAGQRILDVGTGTGRAAVALARAGAVVAGLDASMEMLDVGRSRAREAAVRVGFGRADAHALPVAAGGVDAVVCFRLLMHVIDWRRALAELCRVARHRVVIDFPSARSAAALESAARRLAQSAGRRVEAYRVLSERDVTRELASHGFRVTMVRRQFVLPIAVHKRVNSLRVTRIVERTLASVGLLRVFGSPVTLVAER
jgi:ubiquinone/menaquinone biosynthesis C-methylase UbiE